MKLKRKENGPFARTGSIRSWLVNGSFGKKMIEPGGNLSFLLFERRPFESVAESVPDPAPSKSLVAIVDGIVRRLLKDEGRRETGREEGADGVGSKGSPPEVGSKGLSLERSESGGRREDRRDEELDAGV